MNYLYKMVYVFRMIYISGLLRSNDLYMIISQSVLFHYLQVIFLDPPIICK